ncbi:hypothetical protein WP1_298 [Pseudomonas phage WP1]
MAEAMRAKPVAHRRANQAMTLTVRWIIRRTFRRR